MTLGSGTRLEDFPEEPSQPGAVATAEAWEALETPPQSGYLFEQLLQRIAANLPPELLAAVEARRERGQALREARALARREAAGALGGTAGWRRVAGLLPFRPGGGQRRALSGRCPACSAVS